MAKRDRVELKALVATIREHHDLAARLDLTHSVSGTGLPTAVAILVCMPEIGQVSREQAAALADLAPYDETAESTLAFVTSRVDAKACERRSMLQRWRRPSAGIRNSWPFTSD
ncbi:hypothetical protein AB7M49_004137 [Bradyrhizobium elkanii]